MSDKKKVLIKIWICLFVILLFILINLFADKLAPYDPIKISMADKLEAPSAEHLFGTDNLGRDILSRVMYGGRSSILIAATTTFLSMLLGLVVGVLGGYFGSEENFSQWGQRGRSPGP